MPRPRSASSVLMVVIATAAFPSAAETVWVTRGDDRANPVCPSETECTLRGALASVANGDEIRVSPSLAKPLLIELQAPLLLNRPVTVNVQGDGSDRLALRATGNFRVFAIEQGHVTLSDLTVRDGRAVGIDGSNGAAPGMVGAAGGQAEGGCVRVGSNDLLKSSSLRLIRVAMRNCTAVGGNGGAGAAGLDVERGAGGGGGHGGVGGRAYGGAIAAIGMAVLHIRQSSISESLAIGGDGGNGGRGGGGSLAGGAGGNGARGGDAQGGAIHDGSITEDFHVENASLLGNGLAGGNGGAGGTGGRVSGFGSAGAPGQNGNAGNLVGGQLVTEPFSTLTLLHATLGPAVLEQGVPGRWDGSSASGRGSVEGELIFTNGVWRVRASALVGASAHSPCKGSPPELWAGSGSNAVSSESCLADESMHASASHFVNGMDPVFERGRATARPVRNSRMVDAVACGVAVDQSERSRPQDGDGDGFAVCDIGAIEIDASPTIFADGFEG